MLTPATVYLLDDDPEMRQSLKWMLESDGFAVKSYRLPTELLEDYNPDLPGCIVLDVNLPEMTGLEVRDAMLQHGCRHPFLFITGCGTVRTAVNAIRGGAVDFMEKPFSNRMFLERLREAVRRDAHWRIRREEQTQLRRRFDTLTPREREVMELVVDGKLSKQIARALRISIKTVDVHRSHVTQKLGVESVPQLVRMVGEFENEAPSRDTDAVESFMSHAQPVE